MVWRLMAFALISYHISVAFTFCSERAIIGNVGEHQLELWVALIGNVGGHQLELWVALIGNVGGRQSVLCYALLTVLRLSTSFYVLTHVLLRFLIIVAEIVGGWVQIRYFSYISPFNRNSHVLLRFLAF